jgi:hypothetical protein
LFISHRYKIRKRKICSQEASTAPQFFKGLVIWWMSDVDSGCQKSFTNSSLCYPTCSVWKNRKWKCSRLSQTAPPHDNLTSSQVPKALATYAFPSPRSLLSFYPDPEKLSDGFRLLK